MTSFYMLSVIQMRTISRPLLSTNIYFNNVHAYFKILILIFMAHSHMQKMYTHYIRRCLKKNMYIKVKSCKRSILLTYIPFYAPFTSIFNAIDINTLFVRSYNKENKYIKNYWKKIKMTCEDSIIMLLALS